MTDHITSGADPVWVARCIKDVADSDILKADIFSGVEAVIAKYQLVYISSIIAQYHMP